MFKWITENWVDVSVTVAAIYGAAQAVARITPTKKDDEIISKVGRVLNFIFLKSRTK